MTKQNLYNEIRDKYNEMFPENLELKFGCEVSDLLTADFEGDYWWAHIWKVSLHCGGCRTHKTFKGCENTTVECDYEDKIELVIEDTGYHEQSFTQSVFINEIRDRSKYKILGQPINAQMVLRMLGKLKEYKLSIELSGLQEIYLIEDKLTLVMTPVLFVGEDKVIDLNLSLSSIEHESEETLTALHEILCRNQAKE